MSRNGQLLDRALLRLLPDVFFHPVWTHFVGAEAHPSLEQIPSLLDAVDEMLSVGKPDDACQTLFICAFQQLRANDYAATSSNLQHILVLAEQHGLPHVAWWASWGAASVCVQQGEFQQAAEHLEHLQSMLGQQHEWVLSNVIDVLRQALLSQAEVNPPDRLLPSDAALSSALEQLLHWGTPRAASGIKYDGLIGSGHPGRSVTVSAGFTWRSLWQSIRRIVRGELRLKWVATNGPASLPQPEERKVLLPISPVILTARVPAQMPLADEQLLTLNQQPELERPLTSAQNREPAAVQPVASNRPEPGAESPAAPSIRGHPPLPAVIGERETPAVSALPTIAQRAPESYTMAIYCFGPFRVYQHHQLIEEWNSLRGQAVLKYLVAHRGTPVAKDVLMDVFWLNADPEAARRNLHQAIYSLRQTLRRRDPDFQHIQFENNQYLLNPALRVWIDIEEFQTDFQSGRRLQAAGQLAAAMVDYGAAAALYQGDFLEEDLYDDWPRPQREQLRATYLDIAHRLSEHYRQHDEYSAAIALCQKILTLDNCVEEAHRRLMRCYLAQGQRHLAVRQYHTCVQALAKELDVPPADETQLLYASISANS